jgi:hypothetical protein
MATRRASAHSVWERRSETTSDDGAPRCLCSLPVQLYLLFAQTVCTWLCIPRSHLIVGGFWEARGDFNPPTAVLCWFVSEVSVRYTCRPYLVGGITTGRLDTDDVRVEIRTLAICTLYDQLSALASLVHASYNPLQTNQQ